MQADDLVKIWEDLKDKETSEPLIKVNFRGNEKINIGFRPQDQTRGIMLVLDKDTKKLDIPSVSSFEIKYEDGYDSMLVWWGLADDNFLDYFKFMAFQVANEAYSANDDQKCLSIFFAHINRWQEFLEDKGKKPSLEHTKGLFGELLYIEYLYDNQVTGYEEIITGWHEGSDPKRDFYFEKGSIEIKSTTTNTPDKVKINSLKQLDESTTSNLLFGIVILTESDSDGMHLDELVNRLINKVNEISPNSLTLFRNKLYRQNCFWEIPDYYKDWKFSPYKIRNFHVKDDFPRITPDDITDINRPGIGKVTYDIGYGNLSKHEISSSDIKNII